MSKPMATTLIAGVLALSASACGASGSGGDVTADGPLTISGDTIAPESLHKCALEEGTVDVYTAIPAGTDALWESFESDTGISVNGLVLPTEDLSVRMNSEIAADKMKADVIAMPDQTVWEGLVEDDVLQPNEVAAEKDIPDDWSDPLSPFHGLSLAANVPAYNSEILEGDPPESWSDLLDPSLQGKIGFKPASAGSGGWVLALFTAQKFGKEYWTSMAAQEPVLESSASAVAEALGRGEIAVAVSRPPEIKELSELGAPVELAWPEDGTPMAEYFIAQVKESAGSRHPCAAQVYVSWSMAKAGQDALASEVGDYPVNSKAITPTIGDEEQPSLEEINPYVPSTQDWVGLRDSYVSEWGQIFDYAG